MVAVGVGVVVAVGVAVGVEVGVGVGVAVVVAVGGAVVVEVGVVVGVMTEQEPLQRGHHDARHVWGATRSRAVLCGMCRSLGRLAGKVK